MPFNILHIDTEKSWRGGERQIEFLLKFSDRSRFRHFLAARPESILKGKAVSAGCEVLDVSPLTGFDPFCALRIKRFADKNKIDIIHSHTSHGASLAALVLLLGKQKFVAHRRVDFHLAGGFFSRYKYARADRVITVSGAIKKVLIYDGVEGSNISVVHSGVDTTACENAAALDLREKYSIDSRFLVAGMVNALAAHKGVEYFLEALKILSDRGVNVFSFIVGTGELEKELKIKCVKLGIEKRVVFAGFAVNPLDWIKSFDIFVISSLTEGLGSTVLDALALGKPVVATSAGGIPEMIKSGYNGLLVEPGNAAALADAMENTVADEKLRMMFSVNARESVSEFNVLDTVTKIEKIYEEILR